MQKKLYLSNRDKKIAGVCGGIAEYFNIDSTIIRVIWVLLSVMSTGFPGILLYVIFWAIMPPDNEYRDLR